MASTFVKGVVVGAVVSAITLASSVALAGTGIGGVFNLGGTNAVDASTTLTGTVNGSQLLVTNASTGSHAAGVGIITAAGTPPLVVNSTTQVKNLNASLLGGRAANAFVHGDGTVLQSGLITMPNGTEVKLVDVPKFGSLLGECGDHGFAAGITLTTPHTLGAFLFMTTGGLVTEGSGGHSIPVVPSALPGIHTAQISSGTSTATITAIAQEISTKCQLSVQVVSSHT